MSTPTTPSSSPHRDAAGSWKRKYALLEAQFAAASKEPNVTSKRQVVPAVVSHNTHRTIPTSISAGQISLGRRLRRTVDLFHSARDLVEQNERRIGLEEDGEDVNLSDEENCMIRSYDELIKCVPLLKDLSEQGDAESLEALYKNLRKGSDMARADDTSHLKAAIVGWVVDMLGPSDPPLRARSKDERGFADEHTGQLLCPSEFSWNDPLVRAGIRDGRDDYCVTASSWPVFLYANLSCDQDNLEKGLFKGSLLVKAYKSLFTSPSSVTEGADRNDDEPPPPKRLKNSAATRSHVASLIGLNTVTPRSIAYVAVQVRFSLSSGNSWRATDVDFDYSEFYQAIVDFFEVTPGPVAKARVDDLLTWWNKTIFGRVKASARPNRKGTSVSKLAAQRLAREG